MVEFVILRGLVVDLEFGTPVRAQVRIGEVSTHTDPGSGRFFMEVHCGVGSVQLQVRSPGFKDLTVERTWDSEDVGVIELLAMESTVLKIRNASGFPEAGIRTVWTTTKPIPEWVGRYSWLVGIVTESDLLSTIVEGRAQMSTALAEVMFRRVDTIHQNASARTLLAQLEGGTVGMVVDDEGCLTGILTKTDLMEHLTASAGA